MSAFSSGFAGFIRELKQTRRRRKRERHLKMWLRVSAITFQLFKLIMLEKCVLIILELNWNQRLGQEDKIEHLSSYAHVVHTTAKQVISCRRKNENVCKMSKNGKCTCKACEYCFWLSNMQICGVFVAVVVVIALSSLLLHLFGE